MMRRNKANREEKSGGTEKPRRMITRSWAICQDKRVFEDVCLESETETPQEQFLYQVGLAKAPEQEKDILDTVFVDIRTKQSKNQESKGSTNEVKTKCSVQKRSPRKKVQDSPVQRVTVSGSCGDTPKAKFLTHELQSPITKTWNRTPPDDPNKTPDSPSLESSRRLSKVINSVLDRVTPEKSAKFANSFCSSDETMSRQGTARTVCLDGKEQVLCDSFESLLHLSADSLGDEHTFTLEPLPCTEDNQITSFQVATGNPSFVSAQTYSLPERTIKPCEICYSDLESTRLPHDLQNEHILQYMTAPRSLDEVETTDVHDKIRKWQDGLTKLPCSAPSSSFLSAEESSRLQRPVAYMHHKPVVNKLKYKTTPVKEVDRSQRALSLPKERKIIDNTRVGTWASTASRLYQKRPAESAATAWSTVEDDIPELMLGRLNRRTPASPSTNSIKEDHLHQRNVPLRRSRGAVISPIPSSGTLNYIRDPARDTREAFAKIGQGLDALLRIHGLDKEVFCTVDNMLQSMKFLDDNWTQRARKMEGSSLTKQKKESAETSKNTLRSICSWLLAVGLPCAVFTAILIFNIDMS